MVNGVILISVIVFAIILAGFFAGAETGIYQLSRLRLRLGTEKKRLSFVILGKCLRDSSALLISMLIGNNLSHYLATSVVTYVLLSKVEVAHTAELFATLITAPVLFVFAELIPKSIVLIFLCLTLHRFYSHFTRFLAGAERCRCSKIYPASLLNWLVRPSLPSR